MLKGFVLIFTAIISYFYFDRRYKKQQFIGISLVILGLVFVSLSNIKTINTDCKCYIKLVAPNPLTGNKFVLIGQFFLSGMFVYEEKILKEYDVIIN